MAESKAAAASSSLALYWELASTNGAVRLKAAKTLVETLQHFQTTHSSPSLISEESVIAKDDDEQSSPVAVSNNSTGKMIATQDDLAAECAPDLCYGLKRLLRGLPSARQGARQGFSVALTELIQVMPKIKTALLLDMLFILTESQGSTKGQEERDIYFGRLFGLVAIAESGILSDPTQTESEDVVLILERLIEFTRAKIYLKAPAFKAILLVLKQVQQSLMYSKVSNYAIAAALTGEDSSFGCEELWLVVCLQAREVVDAPWPTLLPDWHNGSPLHPKNLDKLVDLLKESTFLSPILHPLWEDLVSISAAPQKKSKKSISLFQLWSALDNTLFHSTHERKLLGFQLFQKILTALPTPSKSLIFTPNFLRCLMNSLASKDTYLHKAARQTATSIAKMAEQAPEAALDMALQLIGPHGSLNFDSLSKTKTVETILHQLSTVDIQRYIEHLKGLFLTLEKGEKMEEYTKSAEVLRTRVLAQMVMLFKIPKVPKEEAWITDVLKFLCLQGFFVAEDGSTKFQIPKPLLSSKTQKDCQDRLQSILGCLLSTALAGQDARKTQSLTSKGEHWSRAVLEIIEDLLKVDELSLAQSMDEDLMQLIVRGSNLITEIRKKEKKVQKSEAVNALFLSQLTAFEHLVTHIVIQAYSDPREISGLVEDLEECFKKIWESGSGKTKKRKADSSEEEPAPIDVLIDILLSLLSKPSAPLRNLAVQTFKSFTCQMTEASFDVIFEVLTADNSGKGELFEEEDDEDMAEEDSDEESDDDSSDEDSADDDEATEAKADVPDLLITSPPPADVEDDVLGDADMEAYDSKLAEIFKQKAQLKTAKKDLKQQTLHFKFRVIDLLEAFIQKQAQSPLIIKVQSRLLNLVFKAAVDAQIHDRLVALIKNKIFKSKDVPKPESLDIEQVYSDMEEIHQMARKAKDSVFVNLCSFASLYMARILGAAQAIETPSKKKVKVAEDAKTDSAPQFSRISQIYIKSLEDFMTKNKSKVKPSLFLELFSRYNRYSWEILPSLVNMMSHESKPKAYSLIQGYAMVAKMLKQNQRADDDTRTCVLKEQIPLLSKNMQNILEEYAKFQDGPYAINRDRFKEILKDSLALLRCSKKLHSTAEEFSQMWDSANFVQQLKSFMTTKTWEKTPSLANLTKQIESMFSAA